MFAIIEGPADETPCLYEYDSPADVYRHAIKIIQTMTGGPREGQPPLDMTDDASVIAWYEWWNADDASVWVSLDVEVTDLRQR